MRYFEAVILAKRAVSQTIADFFLIYRMNIVGVAGIDGDGETRMGHVLRRESLGFPHLGPGIIHGDIARMLICRQTDNVERKIALTELFPPVGDHEIGRASCRER